MRLRFHDRFPQPQPDSSLSDIELLRLIDSVRSLSGDRSTRGELVYKAVRLLDIACRGERDGLRLALIDTDELKTQRSRIIDIR